MHLKIVCSANKTYVIEKADDAKDEISGTCEVQMSTKENSKVRPEVRSSLSCCCLRSVAAVASCVVTIGLIFLGVCLLLNRNQSIEYHLELSLSDQSTLHQKTSHYFRENIVQQHIVQDNDTQFWILTDFNREIQIIKIHQLVAPEEVCYVTPLNRSNAVVMPPSNVSLPEDPNSVPIMQPTFSPTLSYVSSPDVISETSILGARGQTLCYGANTFWAWPSYETDKGQFNTSAATVTSPVEILSRKRRQGVNVYPGNGGISWCWALLCQSINISNQYSQPRYFINCNRIYHSPC